jgi:AcrR family transcriptional regulator
MYNQSLDRWQGEVVRAPRRIGTEADTRTLLLDAAEHLLLTEGYAAVTSRRVAAEAGFKSLIVHHYFSTMDDLFLDVYRRRAEQGISRFEAAMEVHPSLRTIWRFGNDLHNAAFNIELAALANHRKALRNEMASYAQRFRGMKLDAVADILTAHGISPQACPPLVILVAMTGVTQMMAIERCLGVTVGHQEMLEFVDNWLNEAERNLPAVAAVGEPNGSRSHH